MTGLADHIDDGPMVIPPLKVCSIQFCSLFPAQPASQEDPEQRSISLALERIWVGHLPQRSCLVGGEPVTESDAEVFRPFDSADAGSEIRAEQTRIGGFVGETSDPQACR